jgi:hypothetical protein
MELASDDDGVEVRLADQDSYVSQTTGRVERGETVVADEELAAHLVNRRGFELVEGDGGDDDDDGETGTEEEDTDT